MAIDVERDQLINLSQGAKIYPPYRPEKPTHVSRLIREITVGVPLPTGGRSFLEAIRLGKQWCTTAKAIREHGERIAAAYIGQAEVPPASRTTTSRRRETNRAARELDRIGI